ncbi:hypothetical protein N7478_003907 [Penicillium angulare]|uniref:uncharacterized protein n=1 Tax=Penicillium angulare TaxID=116970 RepID=UPI0025415393|nr:uncharacterized protein N7478_003907 [Penicillium angulare]KAJ5288221.1 hypothetical protein N7478_003907 [Penicillium angulare]
MLGLLPPVTSTGFMVTDNPFPVRDNRLKDRILLRSVGYHLGRPEKQKTMSTSSKDGGSTKGRESRAGARKVSSLSAEQLERKRANDREAQRSIRQRTKEHIEQLEGQVAMLQSQVAEMQPQNDRFGELLQRNSVLEQEVGHLKRQIASLLGRPSFAGGSDQVGGFRGGTWPMDESANNTISSVPSTNAMISPHFSGSSQHASAIQRAPSAVSAPSRSPHPHEWQSYDNNRSLSLADSSDANLSSRMDPYVMDGQMNHGSRLMPSVLPSGLPVASQISFGNSTGAQNTHPSESSFPSVPQIPSHRSLAMSIPTPQAAPVQPYQSSAPSFHLSMVQSSQRENTYTYQPWNSQ